MKLLNKVLKISYQKSGGRKQHCIIQENMLELVMHCGIYEGQETIIDFKQSNKPKKEEWIEDYYLQLGAYSLAHNVVYNSRHYSGNCPVTLYCR